MARASFRRKPTCSDPACWQQRLRGLQSTLRKQFGIEHATLQLEPAGYRIVDVNRAETGRR
jgi:hypothetical protein